MAGDGGQHPQTTGPKNGSEVVPENNGELLSNVCTRAPMYTHRLFYLVVMPNKLVDQERGIRFGIRRPMVDCQSLCLSLDVQLNL